jgi:hypothetical protein
MGILVYFTFGPWTLPSKFNPYLFHHTARVSVHNRLHHEVWLSSSKKRSLKAATTITRRNSRLSHSTSTRPRLRFLEFSRICKDHLRVTTPQPQMPQSSNSHSKSLAGHSGPDVDSPLPHTVTMRGNTQVLTRNSSLSVFAFTYEHKGHKFCCYSQMVSVGFVLL